MASPYETGYNYVADASNSLDAVLRFECVIDANRRDPNPENWAAYLGAVAALRDLIDGELSIATPIEYLTRV